MHKISKVYCIGSANTRKVYIGSTIQSLHSRLRQHRYKRVTSNCSVNRILDKGDCYIKSIEEHENMPKDKLLERERFHIEQNKHSVNNRLPHGKVIRKNRKKFLAYHKYYNDNIRKNKKIKHKDII